MKNIFLFSTLAFLFVFFSCQKETPIDSEASNSPDLITLRGSEIPKKLSQNSNFQKLVTTSAKTLSLIQNLRHLNEGDRNSFDILKNQDSNELTEKDLKWIESKLNLDREVLLSQANLIINGYNNLLEDFPELAGIERSESKILFSQAIKLCRKESDLFRIQNPGGVYNDGFSEANIYITLGCFFSFTKFSFDPNLEPTFCAPHCQAAFQEEMTGPANSLESVADDCIADLIGWTADLGTIGTIIGGGIGSLPGAGIGGRIGVLVGLLSGADEFFECILPEAQKFDLACEVARTNAKFCCGW